MQNTEKVRLAVIGLGSRGGWLVDQFLTMDNVFISALSDVYEDRVESCAARVEKACGEKPFCTTDYREIIGRNVCDAVLISTGWEDHVKIALDMMEAHIPVGLEVGGAYSVADCFRLVETWERTRTPLMFCENCCYDRYELMVLNMVRQGLFGEVVHAEGGYMHDLRTEVLFGRENRHYRLENYKHRNCDNYPTHDLGPIATVLNINRGNRMVSLTSTASKSAGLNDYARLHENVDPALRDYPFAQGDIVVTNIKCADGATITLTLDTTLPRPYSRGFTIRGTRGMYQEDGNYIYLDTDFTEADHWNWKIHWNNAEEYLKKYEHPIWRRYLEDGVRGGHGGIDFLVYDDFFERVKDGRPMPLDVYDAAALMCITPLTAESIRNNSAPVEIPDFTGGAWETTDGSWRFV
ncbi:MAG: Gfo/Idh/MocA family oxidoreductase [Clostridia bacterium]|nr:Gfo/Idh/MocA family oxidoreductase [Clostridia bacterium]